MTHWIGAAFASFIGAVILAATGSTPPDLTGIAAVVTAVIGVAGFLATLVRGRANNKRVEEVEQAASYVKGFDALIKRLQEEIEDLHTEISTERNKWAQEKAELMETIRSLRNELQERAAKSSLTQSELMELRGQIKGFLTAAEYEEFTKHVQ